MRTRRNAVAAAVGLAVVLAAAVGVTGCVQSGPAVIPTSEPGSTPVFSSNAAALAAAKKAYHSDTCQPSSDEVAADGGENRGTIQNHVVTSNGWSTQPKSHRRSKTLVTTKRKQNGSTVAVDRLQIFTPAIGPRPLTAAYGLTIICVPRPVERFSYVLNSDTGAHITSTIATTDARCQLEVDLTSSPTSPRDLKPLLVDEE